MKYSSFGLILALFFSVSNSYAEEIKFEEKPTEINVYAGTFDVIDKEGDDQTSLVGVEHKNENLFRNTILGQFKPITGASSQVIVQFICTQELKDNIKLAG